MKGRDVELADGTRKDGVSFAAPAVGGLIDELRRRYPDLTPADVRQVLRLSGERTQTTADDSQEGAGVLNVERLWENAKIVGDEARARREQADEAQSRVRFSWATGRA